MTKKLPFLTARYTILCARRLQPPRNDCAVRVQWFSSVNNSPTKCKICICSFSLVYLKINVNRVANVRHGHMILFISCTYILDKKNARFRQKKLVSVPHILKTVKRSYPGLVSSFICMFHLLMKFRHLRHYSRRPCFFEFMGHTNIHQRLKR